MRLNLLGHATFFLESSKGTRLITDPYQPGFKNMIGHQPITLEADVVTISHDHGDHSYVEGLPGRPEVFRGQGSWQIADIELQSISSFHDNVEGAARGPNTIFTITMDGLRTCHLGDLGHILSETQINSIGPVEILLVPIGGNFTVGPEDALAIAKRIGAPIWIPMHYKTKKVGFQLAALEEFLGLIENINVERREELIIENANSLAKDTRVYILESIF